MSMKAFRWAKAQEGLSSAEKFVLVMIADHYNDDWHRSWPSQATLAHECQVSESTVKRCVKELRKKGFLLVEEWVINTNAARLSNRYLLPRFHGTLPAKQQPVVVDTYYEQAGGWDGLRRIDGTNLYVEINSLEP